MGIASSAVARLSPLWSFRGRYRALHLAWVAFFLSFLVWFNFAPFATTIAREFDLSDEQLVVLALCNVALTVPARVLVAMALDRWGPRRVYAAILMYAALPCISFAAATSFAVLVASRLAVGVVGSGFVVGIRMVAEHFPPREIGVAEGVYAGWGNAGSAAAALALPAAAAVLGHPDGWRWAVGATGVLAAAYGAFFLRVATDSPDGRPWERPHRQGALEVTSPAAVAGLIALQLPLVGALGLVAWRLARVGFLSPSAVAVTGSILAALLALQVRAVWRVNRPARERAYAEHDRYPLRSVAVLCLAYAVTFGSELAVISMLPAFFAGTFGLSTTVAAASASAFAFMNLGARPLGGLLSDVLGDRRRTLAALVLALAAGYAAMASISSSWPLALAVAAAMGCSAAVQAGEGATFAIVPLVKRRVSGQIAGLVGAYGNVGALAFLTVLLFVGPAVFFLAIAASAAAAAVACRWLVEPAEYATPARPPSAVRPRAGQPVA